MILRGTGTFAIALCLIVPCGTARAEKRNPSTCVSIPPSPPPDAGIGTAASAGHIGEQRFWLGVRSGSGGAPVSVDTGSGGSGSVPGPNLPNLTPRSPSVAPLLRKINSKSATMIPMFYCGSVPDDQEMAVDVPAFDWGVANDDRAEISQAFSVAVLEGTSNAPLAKETVQSIPRSGTRIFRNWPGRPSHVRAINVTAANPKFGSDYDSSPGCYIPAALVGSVTLDPKSLIVRVDADGQITERVESDNDLKR